MLVSTIASVHPHKIVYRIQEYNSVLEAHAAKYGYIYVPQIYETQFSLNDLSDFDCFHPNVSGQNRIADIIWDYGFNIQ